VIAGNAAWSSAAESRSYAHSPFVWSGTALVGDSEQKVDYDENIEDEHKDLDYASAMDDLVNFKGQERGCNHDGEPFGPVLQSAQTDTFGQEQTGIDKTDGPELLEPGRRESGGLLDGVIDHPASRIEAKTCDPVFQLRSDVPVNQFQEAEANHDQARSLEKLEHSYASNHCIVREIHE
jgi:hypothetical protein